MKTKNPRLVDRLARLVFGVPPLFAVQDYWTQDFNCEEIYQVEEKSERVEEDNDEGEDEEDDGIPRRLLDRHHRLVKPGDDLVVFLCRHRYRIWCDVSEVFSASPNIRGKYGLSPLFLAKGHNELEDLLKLDADPFVCDIMGRNTLFANLWEPESENNLREDPRDRSDSEVPRDCLEEYLKFAGKDKLLALLKGNESGLDCFQQAKMRGNPLTLEFLTKHFPEETEAAVVPAELLEPLSFVENIRTFMRGDDSLKHFIAVGVVPKQQEDSQLENFLADTLIQPAIFPPGYYEYQGSEEFDFDNDEIPWREECLGEERLIAFRETFRLVSIASFYFEQCGYGDVSTYIHEDVFTGFAMFLVVGQKYEK